MQRRNHVRRDTEKNACENHAGILLVLQRNVRWCQSDNKGLFDVLLWIMEMFADGP